MTQVPVIETILHPPLGLLVRDLIPGTFSGQGELTRPSPGGILQVNAVGLTFDIFTIPAGVGRTEGVPPLYEDRLVQLATHHNDLGGHSMISEYHDFFAEGLWWMWENPFPSKISYVILPGVELTFFWLVV